ncbi:15516_t:CDS:1, partial [Racocetra persica]
KLARNYLTIQATSISCEQAFSLAGLTISKTRNRLLPKTARASICLKNWITEGLGLGQTEDIVVEDT